MSNFSNKLQFKISELSRDEKADGLKDIQMFGVFIKGNPNISSFESMALCLKLYDLLLQNGYIYCGRCIRSKGRKRNTNSFGFKLLANLE